MKRITFALLFVLVFGSLSYAQDRYGEADAYTVDATQVESGILWSPQDGAAFIVSMNCIARQSNGTGREAFKQTALISRDAGTTTAVAVGKQEKVGNASTWLLSAAIVNNNVVFRATGAAGATINWNCYMSGYQVGPY